MPPVVVVITHNIICDKNVEHPSYHREIAQNYAVPTDGRFLLCIMRFVASAALVFFLLSFGVVVFVDHAWSFVTINPGHGVLRVQLSIRSSLPWTSWKAQQQPTVTRKNLFCNSLDRPEKFTTVAKARDDDGCDAGDGGKGDNSGDENLPTDFDDDDDDDGENKYTLPELKLTGDPLKDQINKAKQQFAALSPKIHSCKDAFPAIEAALAKGVVKPLFHAHLSQQPPER